MPKGFLEEGFLTEGFLMAEGESGIYKNHYVLCQINGFIGERIIGGPRIFSIDVIQYEMGATGWKILFYDKADKTQKIGELSSDIGQGVITGISFDLVETGCGDFDIEFGADPASLPFTIEYNQGIEIYLYHDINPWYAGYITKMPVSGSTKRPWTIKGAGYFNQLETCVVDKNYNSQEVSDIVRDVMAEFVEEKTDIVYADYKILETDYTTTTIKFDHITGKKAMGELKDLAQNFVFGVDEKRELFFNGTDPTVNPLAIFVVGKHLDGVEIDEDAEAVVNKVYVKAGLLSGSPKSNIQAMVNDYNSQVVYGLREKVMTAPSVHNADDAERWGRWQIDNLKKPKKKAKIKWADCSNGPIRAKGKARILDNNGNEHKLAIEKVSYSVDSDGIGCSLSLGQMPNDAGKILRDILFDIANDELLESANMGQL